MPDILYSILISLLPEKGALHFLNLNNLHLVLKCFRFVVKLQEVKGINLCWIEGVNSECMITMGQIEILQEKNVA